MFEHLSDKDGILLRRVAVAHGCDDNALKRGTRTGELIRIRQGIYVLSGVWSQASEVGRHALLVGGVLKLYDGDVAASHQSACLLQGGPSWGLDLSTAHVTSLHGIGERCASRVTHHRGAVRVNDVTRRDGRWITTPCRTALDTASMAGRDAGVCVLDWYLNQGLVTHDQLRVGFGSRVEWPGSLPLHVMLQLADGRSESVGESRTRLLCVDHRVPVPTLQFEVRHPSGLLAGRTDFAWPERGVLGEFDGRAKYLRLRRPGESIEEAVLREKAREDLLRELTGWSFIRLDWADLATPAATAARLHRVLGRAAA